LANILLVWELGAGRGHLTPLRQLAERLIVRGHRVSIASRDVPAAGEIFTGLPAQLFAAPYLAALAPYTISPVRSFVDILYNIGFGSQNDLSALMAAWISIYEAVRPDVIVFDHSPTALAAAHVAPARRVLMGIGFGCPPPGKEIEDLRRWLPKPGRSSGSQTCVLENLNAVRRLYSLPPLASVGGLFSEVDANALATFPELDHFGPRPNGQYVGVFPESKGVAPQWPAGGTLRAFGYLKPHDLLDGVVAELTRRRISTVLFTGSSDPKHLARWSTECVSVSPIPLDVETALHQADVAILNGTHGTTASTLLAGRPSIHAPLVLEQWLVAHRVTDLHAGVILERGGRNFSEVLDDALSGGPATAAAAFAEARKGFDREASVSQAVATVESVASS
jgi:hypothetical protein